MGDVVVGEAAFVEFAALGFVGGGAFGEGAVAGGGGGFLLLLFLFVQMMDMHGRLHGVS